MKRNLLLLALLSAMGLAICWPPSGMEGIRPRVGSKEGGPALSADLAASRGPEGMRVREASHSPDAKAAAWRNQVAQNYGKLPLSFEPNSGQTDSEVNFLSRGPGYTLFLTGDQAVLRLRSKPAIPSRQEPVHRASLQRPEGRKRPSTMSEPRKADSVLSMRLLGANPHATARGADELPGKANYLIGSDPQKWRTHVPTYAQVKFANVYPGVDLFYYGNQSGQLEYDFVVAPGADPSAIALSVMPGVQEERKNSKIGNQRSAGKTALRIAPDGDLVVHLGDGDVRLHKPVVYQEAESEVRGTGLGVQDETRISKIGNRQSATDNRQFVESHYTLDAQNRVRFQVGPYDHTKPLCIDPILNYSTYLGGAVSDTGYGIAIDSSGDAYIAGATSSPNFPNAKNALDGTAQDAFITELNSTGTAVVYYTYLGGSGADSAYGITVDSTGDAYVTGLTMSGDFPTLNPLAGSTNRALSTSYNGTNSYVSAYGTGFVAELAPGGGSLVFSTYLGGSNGSGGVAGYTGVAGDIARGIAVNSTCAPSLCNVYVTGNTVSTDFPVTAANAYEPNALPAFTQAAFVSMLSWNGSALTNSYSTYLGGISVDDLDYGAAIVTDSSGRIYVAGQSLSSDFPTSANTLPSIDYGSGSYIFGVGNAFVTEMDPTQAGASSLLFSTYFGGNAGSGDAANGIAVDPSGNIYIAGMTRSSDLPTANPLPGSINNGPPNPNYAANNTYAANWGTGFVAEINPTVPELMYSTYLGGTAGIGDSAQGIAVDSLGDAFVVGFTKSTNFPTVQNVTYSFGNIFNLPSSPPGGSAAFASEISPLDGALLLSTFLGGSGNDVGNAVAVDSSGDMFLTGSTSSANFPTAAPYLPPPVSHQDLVYQPGLGTNGTQTATQNAFVAMIQAAAYATISLSNSTYTFDNTLVDTTSADSAEPIMVTNIGNAAAVFYSITIVPDPGVNPLDFTQVNNCPSGASTLGISAQCTISVTFHPSLALREHAKLVLDDSASNGEVTEVNAPEQMVDLYGTGLLGVVITAQNKTYDSTSTAVTTCSPVGVAPADVGNVTCAAASATFSDPNVGNGKTVTATGITLGGSAASNYLLGATTATTTANITPALLTPVVTVNNKTYDTTTTATIATRSLMGVLAVDTGNVTLTGGTANFSDANAGNGKTVTVTGLSLTGSAAGNYELSPATATTTANITPASVTPSVTANNKTYDGTTAATISSCTLAGVYSVDTGLVTCAAANSTFADATVGNNKTVTATGISLTGSAASNYVLSSTTATTTANILPATASVTPNAASKVYGAVDPTFTGTLTGFEATDGVTATYSRTPGQTVAGSPYTISATLSPAGVLGNYKITYNTAQFTITAAALTITASSPSMIYGGPVPPITPLYSGFVNGDTASSLTTAPTCSTTAASGSAVGSYASTCTGAVDTNYTISYVNGQVTESPAPLTITANSVSITAGSPLPTFTATYSGFVNGNTAANLNGTPVCTTTATNTNTAGNYPITCSGQSSPNYSITYVAGTLTITGSVSQGNPIASVTPTCLSFTGLTEGDCRQWGGQPSAPQTVTLSNTGTAVLDIASIKITGTQASDFSMVNNCGSTLAAGAECTITVSFNPQTVGPEQASLVITDNSNGIAGSQQTVSLNGVGLTKLPSNFNGHGFKGGSYLWCTGSLRPQNINPNATTSFFMTNGTVTFTENNQNIVVNIPDSIVTFSPNVRSATTSFDNVNNRWVTVAPSWGINGNTFLSAVAYQVPNQGLSGSISNVAWTAAFSTDTPGASLSWQWAAAPYGTLPTVNDANNNQSCDYNSCNVKPVDDNHSCQYRDNEFAGTPEGWQNHCYAGGTCDGNSNHTGNFCNPGGPTCKPGPVYTPSCSTAPPTRCGQTCPPVPIKVCNRGSQPIRITGVKCSGDFQVSNNVSGTELQPGQSSTINVTFCPTQKGTRCGTLQVTDNTTSSPHTVYLTGNGQ